MQIHELNTFSGIPGDTDFLAIDAGFDTAKISAKNLLAEVNGGIDKLENVKVNIPLDGNNQPTNGAPGQSLRTNGDGTTEWSNVGLPTDAQTAQAVSEWLDAHPEATTTVQDGSITEAKLSSALQLKTIKDYVTPEMFGAVGDGETDDTLAIQNASDYSQSNNIALVCPNKYLISNTITFINSTIIDGEIIYSGNATAIVIDAGTVYGKLYKINLKCKDVSTTTLGVKVINSMNNIFEFNYVEQFYKAIEFWGDGKGCAYNKIYLNYIFRYCIGLSLINNNDGWVNENTFYGGRFYRHNIYSDNVAVFMDSIDGLHVNQNNTFITPCLENSKIAFYFKYGRNTNVNKARTENVTTVLKADAKSYGNIIDVAFGEYTIDSPDAVNYIFQYREDRISTLLNKVVFDSGDLSNVCASNSTGASSPSLYLYNASTGKSPIMLSIQAVEDGLSYKQGEYGFTGVMINKNDSRIFDVFVNHTGYSSIGIIQFDNNGDVIDEPPVVYMSHDFYKETVGATKLGVASYYVTDNVTIPQVFAVSPNCVKFFLFTKGTGAGRVVHRFRVLSDGNANFERLQDHATLDAIPTSTGYNGQFVKAQSPTSSCIGWIYFNNQWNVVSL